MKEALNAKALDMKRATIGHGNGRKMTSVSLRLTAGDGHDY